MKVSDPARVALAPTVLCEFRVEDCPDCGRSLPWQDVTISGPIFPDEIGEIGRFAYAYCDPCNVMFRCEARADD